LLNDRGDNAIGVEGRYLECCRMEVARAVESTHHT
jgi:hypothetical protein